jgi:hypothetical protein
LDERLTTLDALARACCAPAPAARSEISAASALSQPMVAWGCQTTMGAWLAGARALLRQSGLLQARGPLWRGPALCGHVWASTLPTSGWIPVLGSLALGGRALIKAPDAVRPAADLLRDTLSALDPSLQDLIEVQSWAGGGPEDETLVQRADALVVSGGAQAIARYADLMARKPHAPLLPFGPGWSLAAVPSEALARPRAWPKLARALALDVAAYDQRGCLSPQALWLETHDEAQAARFCALLAQALDALADTLPRGPLDAATHAALHQRIASARFMGKVWEVRDGAVLLEPTPYRSDNPLARTLPVHLYQGGPQGLAHALGKTPPLHASAVAGDATTRADYARALQARGLHRACPPGTLQTPPATWRHDGYLWLAHLERFTDLR